MSTSTHHRSSPGGPRAALQSYAARAARVALLPIRALGFWLGVALPFVAVALVALGVPTRQPLTFAALLAVDVVALVVGRDYRRDAARSHPRR